MEGVTFSLREGAEVIEALTGRAPETVVASGGAAKSKLWLQLQADIFNRPITTVVGQERAVVGAAMLAAIGTGFFASFEEAARAWVQFGQRIQPEPQRAQFYADLYQRYRALYPLLRSELHALSAVRLMQW
jgi:xylulokinase